MSECVTLTAVAEQAGQRLDRWLADTLGRDDLSRSRLKALIQGGALCRDGQVITDPSAKVSADTAYSLTLPDAVPAIPQAEPLPLDILFEDEHLICINKAAGMVVHPAPGALSGTLVNALLAHCGGSLTGIGGGPARHCAPAGQRNIRRDGGGQNSRRACKADRYVRGP